jgi:hypothetical protein
MSLSLIPALFGLIISLKMIEPKVHKEETTNIYAHLREALSYFRNNYQLRMLSLSKIIEYAQGEAGYQFKSVFVNTLWPLWAVGLSKMMSNVGAALSFHFSGKIIKKYKPFPVLLVGRVYSIIGGFIALIYPTVFSPVIMSSSSVFFGSDTIAMSDLLQKQYSTHQRSIMGSLNSLVGSIVFAIVAFGLGFFADQIGPANALLALKLLAVISTLILWKLFRNKN